MLDTSTAKSERCQECTKGTDQSGGWFFMPGGNRVSRVCKPCGDDISRSRIAMNDMRKTKGKPHRCVRCYLRNGGHHVDCPKRLS
jgi:hypothetical protein